MRKSSLKHIPHFKVLLVCVVSVFLIVTGFLLLKFWEDGTGRFSEHEEGASGIVHEGVEYVQKENIETFLVLGLDKFDGDLTADSYNNNQQADFLMLFVLNNDTKQFTALHINRDTMADINVLGVAGNKVDTVRKQIALAHTYGNGKDLSCHNTADALSSLLLGIKINHYASVKMDGVSTFNDLVGGVELIVMDDLTGIDDTLVKGETVKLTGEQALTYVQSRQGLEDSTNSTRMQRQKQYLYALREAFNSKVASDDKFIVEATVKMSDYIVSDRSVTQLQALGDKISTYEFLGIKDIAGESVLGEEYMEFYPNEELLKELVIELFYKPKE